MAAIGTINYCYC